MKYFIFTALLLISSAFAGNYEMYPLEKSPGRGAGDKIFLNNHGDVAFVQDLKNKFSIKFFKTDRGFYLKDTPVSTDNMSILEFKDSGALLGCMDWNQFFLFHSSWGPIDLGFEVSKAGLDIAEKTILLNEQGYVAGVGLDKGYFNEFFFYHPEKGVIKFPENLYQKITNYSDRTVLDVVCMNNNNQIVFKANSEILDLDNLNNSTPPYFYYVDSYYIYNFVTQELHPLDFNLNGILCLRNDGTVVGYVESESNGNEGIAYFVYSVKNGLTVLPYKDFKEIPYRTSNFTIVPHAFYWDTKTDAVVLSGFELLKDGSGEADESQPKLFVVDKNLEVKSYDVPWEWDYRSSDVPSVKITESGKLMVLYGQGPHFVWEPDTGLTNLDNIVGANYMIDNESSHMINKQGEILFPHVYNVNTRKSISMLLKPSK